MLLIGFLICLYVAYAAQQRRALSTGGAICAVAVGTTVFGLGGGVPGLCLLTFFLTSTALSRHRKHEKQTLTGELLDKGDERDAAQVLANGGPAAGFCLLFALFGEPLGYVAALGSLAAATADTWATEIGLLAARPPRHLLTWQHVPAGTSGAVTEPGLWGMTAGAVLIGLVTYLEPGSGSFARLLAVALGGIAGGLADSVLGATVQERRSCLNCNAATEQRQHSCGGQTVCIGGIAGIDNDTVNAVATALGGTVTALLWMLLGGGQQ